MSAIRAGYKQTEVGVIPEDWEVKRFGEIGSLSKGKGLLKEDLRASGAVPAIPYTALYTDFSEVLDYQRIKWFVDDTAKTIVLGEPCVLIASSSNMEANTGKASALIGNTPVAIGREVIVFKSTAVASYVSYLLSTSHYRKRTLVLARGTTIKHLYPATFVDYKISLPPLPEQCAIAGALSDADALIESLEQLLAKKRHLKQGAMQELLTGKKRLPGFSGEWEVKRLGEVLTICHGKSQHAVEDRNGSYPILATGGQIGTANHYLYDKPSVLIGRKGTIDEPRYMDTPFWSVDTLFYSVIHEPNCAKFLFYRFCLIAWKQHNEASGVPSLNAKTIERIEVAIPRPEEQIAIASTLSDMDTEIATLDAELAKTHALKQGMMQKLLTGEIRLI